MTLLTGDDLHSAILGIERRLRRHCGVAYLLGIGAALALVLPSVDAALAGESNLTGYYVDVGSRQAPLRLWVVEQGQGEPVLMIHGLGASTYTWRYLLPDLARTHRIIAVDLKGAGKSDKPLDEAYGILDQAAVSKTLVARNSVSNLTIVGHSLGGGIALALALDPQGLRARPTGGGTAAGTVSHASVSEMIAMRPKRASPEGYVINGAACRGCPCVKLPLRTNPQRNDANSGWTI